MHVPIDGFVLTMVRVRGSYELHHYPYVEFRLPAQHQRSAQDPRQLGFICK